MRRSKRPLRKIGHRLAPDRQSLRRVFDRLISIGGTEHLSAPTSETRPKASKPGVSTTQREAFYRDKLARQLNGRTEVRTPDGGRIDIVTSTEIIEVKVAKNWRNALGQIKAYGVSFPKHRQRVHLFGDTDKIDRRFVEKVCLKEGVRVTWEA